MCRFIYGSFNFGLLTQTATAVALITTSSPSFAAEALLQEVIVTASRGKNPLDIAQPTAVLSGDDLARQLTGSLGETLSRQLGVTSSYFGSTASRPVIRGLGGYRVQTLQDGIASLDVSTLSDDHAVTLDPSLAEQIEIIKGPATLLYGSGAAGGLINVVTHRIPNAPPKGGFDAMSELRGGTATKERAGVASFTAGSDHLAIHGDFFKSKSDALKIPGANISKYLQADLVAAGEPFETQEGSIPNAYSNTQGGAFGASWLQGDGVIGGSVSRYETTYGIPSEATAFIDMKQTRYDALAEWRFQSHWLRRIELRGAYNNYSHTEFEAPGVPGTFFTQQAAEARLAIDHVHSNTWRGTIGAQVTRIDFIAEGDEAFVPASLTTNLGGFFLEEYELGPWTFNVGTRVEKQSIDLAMNSGMPNFNNTAASLAAGTVWKFSDIDTLALNVTRSARHPQATELYANGPHIASERFELGDAKLDTEIAYTIDISIRHDSDELSWLLSVFYNDYKNFIFANPTGNIADGLAEVKYTQLAAQLFGYEAELWTPLLSNAQGGIVRLRIMSDMVRGERYSLAGKQPLPQIPPLRFGAGLHFDQGDWHGEIEGIHYTAQNRLAPNERPTDSYTLVNADISYALAISRDSATADEWLIFLRGTNLLNQEARQHSSALKDLVPMPGCSLNAGMRISF